MRKYILIIAIAASSLVIISCCKKQSSKETSTSKKEESSFAYSLSSSIEHWSLGKKFRHYNLDTYEKLLDNYSNDRHMMMCGMDGYGRRSHRNYFEEADNLIIKNTHAFEGELNLYFNDEVYSLINKGVKYCEKKSEDENDTYHKAHLASFYLRTHSKLKDVNRFLYWSHKDAESGNELGMLYLAYAYASGTGVLPDLEESLKWVYLADISTEISVWPHEILKEMEELHPEKMAELKPKSLGKAKLWMQEHPNTFFNPST